MPRCSPACLPAYMLARADRRASGHDTSGDIHARLCSRRCVQNSCVAKHGGEEGPKRVTFVVASVTRLFNESPRKRASSGLFARASERASGRNVGAIFKQRDVPFDESAKRSAGREPNSRRSFRNAAPIGFIFADLTTHFPARFRRAARHLAGFRKTINREKAICRRCKTLRDASTWPPSPNP